LALGVYSPDILARHLTSSQLTEWQAYYVLEPFGHDAEWSRTGTVAAVIASVFRKKGRSPYKPTDFMPAPKLTKVQKAKQVVDGLLEFFGGVAKKKDGDK